MRRARLEPFENSPTKLLVRKDLMDDGTVADIADLAGLTVAMAGGPGSGGEYLAAKALERGDLTIRDVETVQLGNADMPAAFENGSIDCRPARLALCRSGHRRRIRRAHRRGSDARSDDGGLRRLRQFHQLSARKWPNDLRWRSWKRRG